MQLITNQSTVKVQLIDSWVQLYQLVLLFSDNITGVY